MRGHHPDCHSELWAGTQPSLVPALSPLQHMDTHQTWKSSFSATTALPAPPPLPHQEKSQELSKSKSILCHRWPNSHVQMPQSLADPLMAWVAWLR